MRRALSLATSAAIILALLGLAVTTVVIILAMERSNEKVTKTRAIATTFVELRAGLAEEAFAEAGYRRAPSPKAWERLEAAMEAMPALIAEVRDVAGPVDDATLSRLAVLNTRYATQVRATRDSSVTSSDDRVAGPALDTMSELLEATIARHREAITAATADQTELITTLRWSLPVVFAFTFGLLGWALRLNRQEQRRLRREAAAQRRRALHDPLTGLANRAALVEALDQVTPSSAQVLLLIDLDRFKPVNDTWGHPVGDAVLIEVGRRIRSSLPDDAVAARLGGDEFAVLIATPEPEALAQRLVEELRAPYDVDGRCIRIGASIGAARTGAGTDAAALLRSADEALYRAKSDGRGRAVVPA